MLLNAVRTSRELSPSSYTPYHTDSHVQMTVDHHLGQITSPEFVYCAWRRFFDALRGWILCVLKPVCIN